MRNPDEHIYLKALASGDKRGLSWIFDQYRHVIFTYSIKLLKDMDLAEEVTSDVFIKVWEKRKILDTDRSIQPFLYKLTKDIVYSYLRKIASQERLREKFQENYAQIDSQDGEALYLKKEYAEAVSRIIEALPPQRQLIFKMRYLDGKDNPYIAQELKLSIHTVKSQLVKARVFVREQLEMIGIPYAYMWLGFLLISS